MKHLQQLTVWLASWFLVGMVGSPQAEDGFGYSCMSMIDWGCRGEVIKRQSHPTQEQYR